MSSTLELILKLNGVLRQCDHGLLVGLRHLGHSLLRIASWLLVVSLDFACATALFGMFVHVGPIFAGSFSFLAQESRSLRFLCCPVLVYLSVSVASLLVMLLPRLPLHLHCVGLRNQVSLACMLEAHGHKSVTLVCFLWTAVSLLGFQLDAFLSLWTLARGLLVLVTLAALVSLGVASYSTPLRRAFVSIVPHFLMDSLSGWSVPCFLVHFLCVMALLSIRATSPFGKSVHLDAPFAGVLFSDVGFLSL